MVTVADVLPAKVPAPAKEAARECVPAARVLTVRVATPPALNGADPMRHHAGARCFAGNFLFSTGPNSQGGGKRTTKGHYDVPMRDCTVALDNDVIIDRGKFTDEKMQVAYVPH